MAHGMEITMIEMKFVLEAALAFLVVFVATPVVIALCNRWKLLDAPGPLKIHAKPVPRLGGIAVAAGLLAATAIAGAVTHTPVALFLACVAILAVLGIADDVRGVSPYTRLAVQTAIGVYLGASGFGIALSNSSALNVLVAAAIVVAFINAFNFLDGSDALTAGVASVIAIAYIVTAGPYFSSLSGIVAWGLLGSTASFLLFNAPPARIFLGDSGSTVIGLAVAYLAVEHLRSAPSYASPGTTLFPFVVAAVPLADAGLAIARRLQKRTSPLYGDRSHFYDLLLRKGYSARAVALTEAGVTAAAGIVGWTAMRCGPKAALTLIVGFFSVLVAAGVYLGSIPFRLAQTRQRAPRTSIEI